MTRVERARIDLYGKLGSGSPTLEIEGIEELIDAKIEAALDDFRSQVETMIEDRIVHELRRRGEP